MPPTERVPKKGRAMFLAARVPRCQDPYRTGVTSEGSGGSNFWGPRKKIHMVAELVDLAPGPGGWVRVHGGSQPLDLLQWGQVCLLLYPKQLLRKKALTQEERKKF